QIRNIYFSHFNELDLTILANKELYPDSIIDLKTIDVFISYSNNSGNFNYKYNLLDSDGNFKKATICYIGTASQIDVKRTYDSIQSVFDYGDESKRRIVVFYKRGNTILSESDPNAGSIINPPTDTNSII